jgi:hypothetical protein
MINNPDNERNLADPNAAASDLANTYESLGYLNLPNLLSQELIEELREAFASLEERGLIRVGKTNVVDSTDVMLMLTVAISWMGFLVTPTFEGAVNGVSQNFFMTVL